MKHGSALEAAGIPADKRDAANRYIERVLGIYDHRMQQPKDAVETLGRVADTVDKLRGLVADLPDDVRFSLMLVTDVHEDDMLAKLADRARQAQQIMRKPRGRQMDPLDGLLVNLIELWRRDMPDTIGIQREHPTSRYLSESGGETGHKSRARNRGPLLDLAIALLDAEGIEYTSELALGQRLLSLWATVE